MKNHSSMKIIREMQRPSIVHNDVIIAGTISLQNGLLNVNGAMSSGSKTTVRIPSANGANEVKI